MSKAQFICVANQKGGCGKTYLTVHLAGLLKRSGRSVVVLDLDNSRASATWLEKADPEIGTFATESIDEFVDKFSVLSSRCDFILADTPPTLPAITLAAVTRADLVIIPSLIGGTDVRAAGQAFKGFEKLGRSKNGMRIVLNQFAPGTNAGIIGAGVLENFDCPVAKTFLRPRSCVNTASSMRVFVWDLKPDRGAVAASDDLEKLYHEDFNGFSNQHGGDHAGTGQVGFTGDAAQDGDARTAAGAEAA